MNFRFILPTAALLFSINAQSAETTSKIGLSVDSYNYSQAKYINDYIGDFSGSIKKGDHAVSLNKLTFDVQYGNFNFGIFKRLDYQHSFSSDTARLQHNIKNNITPNSPEIYTLNLKMEHFEASGIELGYQWQPHTDISFSLTGNYFLGLNFHSGELTGYADWNSNEDLEIVAPTIIYTAKNELLEFPMADSNGEGFSIDLGLSWQLNDQWNIQLQADDTVSEINWNKALLNQINRWEVYQINESGDLDISSVFEGMKLNYQQTLTTNYKASITYTRGDSFEYFSTLFQNEVFSHHHLGIKKYIDNGKTLIFAWHRDLNAFEIGLKTPYANFELVTDSISSKKRHVFNLSLGLSYAF